MKFEKVLVVLLALFVVSGKLIASEEKKEAKSPEQKKPEESKKYTTTFEFKEQFTGVSGDDDKFRELVQIKDGFLGGISRFSMEKDLDNDMKLSINGRALDDSDVALNLKVTKENLGSVMFKTDTFRRYHDSTVIWYPYAPYKYELNSDDYNSDYGLFYDRSLFGFETSLELPDLPKFVFGFEKGGKKGNGTYAVGGEVLDAPANNWHAMIQPLFYEVNYDSYKYYFGISKTVGGFDVNLRQTWENFEGNRQHFETGIKSTGATFYKREFVALYDNNIATTSLDVTRKMTDDIRLYFNFAYTTAENRNSYDINANNGTSGTIAFGEHNLTYNDNEHSGDSSNYVFEVRPTWFINEQLSAYFRLKYKNGKSDSNSTRKEEGRDDTASDNNPATSEEVWVFNSDSKERTLRESIGITSTHLPKTRVNLDVDLEQSEVDYDQLAEVTVNASAAGESSTGKGNWQWDATNKKDKIYTTIGVRSNIIDQVTGNLKYRRLMNKSDLSEDIDTATLKTGDQEYTAPAGYEYLYFPGFIEKFTRPTDDFRLSLNVKACNYAVVRPQYGYLKTKFKVEGQQDDIGKIADYTSNSFGLGLDLTLVEQVFLSLNYTNTDNETDTLADGATNSAGKNPYTGAKSTTTYSGAIEDFDGSYQVVDIYTSYALRESILLRLNGNYATGEGNFDTTFWSLGAGVDHKISDTWTLSSSLTRYVYDEDDNANINNFIANTILVGLVGRF
ncbi:MAG: hypothetical protein HY606_14790 [Planctomycetes bacterium]|nr:hypothetical protein [Planctomycetota bacterium]